MLKFADGIIADSPTTSQSQTN